MALISFPPVPVIVFAIRTAAGWPAGDVTQPAMRRMQMNPAMRTGAGCFRILSSPLRMEDTVGFPAFLSCDSAGPRETTGILTSRLPGGAPRSVVHQHPGPEPDGGREIPSPVPPVRHRSASGIEGSSRRCQRSPLPAHTLPFRWQAVPRSRQLTTALVPKRSSVRQSKRGRVRHHHDRI